MKRRIAFLIEFNSEQHEWAALRRLLKRLLRGYGLRCLGIRPAAETKTFADHPATTTSDNLRKD